MAFNHQSLPNATDVAISFGGKDFSVLLPNTRPKDAIDISERMRQNIYDIALEHKTSSVADYVTISCRVASMVPTGEKSAADLIKQADEALYQTKAAGRNRTVESQ